MKSKIMFLLLTAFLVSRADAAITLPSMFGDNMVLQRDAPISVWGTAEAGKLVKLQLADQTVSAMANKDGAWRVQLAPLTASKQPQSLTIQSAVDETTITNVLIGDVWVGSGQSNMAGRVASYAKNDTTLATLVKQAPFPQIRLLHGGTRPTWTEATTDEVNRFSALHFAFGERLQRELNVPVGLILGAVGGTPSGYWIPSATYAESEKCRAEVKEFADTYDHDAAMRQYKAKLAAWEKAVVAAEANGKKPRGRKPNPPAKPGASARGGKIGGLYERYIQPVVGYRIRGVLWDQGEARSGVVGVDQHTMMSELIRGWRAAWGQGEFPFLFVQKPSGGGCAFTNDDPVTRNGDKFVKSLPDVSQIGSGEQRYLYVRLMHDNANAWMVPASDLGSGIHPTNKWGYGNRAAEVALSQVYQTGVQAYGPMYKSHKVVGDKLVISFDHVGKGLTPMHSDQLQGFAVAGDDLRWHWAKAEIQNDNILVWSEHVPQPTRVRYAFAQKRAWANLFNKNGLPALSFEAGK